MPWTAHDGGEYGSGCIVTRKTSFAHSRAIIDYKRLYIFLI
jgi:hypothetical protein